MRIELELQGNLMWNNGIERMKSLWVLVLLSFSPAQYSR